MRKSKVASKNKYFELIKAGFPSPADDFIEKHLDLNEFLIKNTAATFFVRVKGTSMVDANIQSGDILIVDRSIEVQNNMIIVAIIDGEFTVKRFVKNEKEIYLIPENKSYKTIRVDKNSDFEVWGVVTYVIHQAVGCRP